MQILFDDESEWEQMQTDTHYIAVLLYSVAHVREQGNGAVEVEK